MRGLGIAVLTAACAAACGRSPASRLSLDSLPPDTPQETRAIVERLRHGREAVAGLSRGQALIDLRDFKGEVGPVIPFVVELIADSTTVEKRTFVSGPDRAPNFRLDAAGRRIGGTESVTTIAEEAQITLLAFGAASFRPLVRALEHPHAQVADAASLLLPRLSGVGPMSDDPWKEGVDIVDRVLRQGRRETMIGAAAVARFLGEPRLIEPLLARVADRSDSIREHAVSALGALAVDPATLRYQSPMPPVTVTHAVAFQAVVTAATDEDVEVRAAAAKSMAGVLETNAAQALCGLATAASPAPGTSTIDANRAEDVRIAAFKALDESVNRLRGNKTAIPADVMAHPFTAALRERCRPTAVAPYLRNRYGHLQGVLLLEVIGGDEAVSALIDALDPALRMGLGNEEIVAVLSRMTGRSFDTVEDWRRWRAGR